MTKAAVMTEENKDLLEAACKEATSETQSYVTDDVIWFKQNECLFPSHDCFVCTTEHCPVVLLKNFKYLSRQQCYLLLCNCGKYYEINVFYKKQILLKTRLKNQSYTL